MFLGFLGEFTFHRFALDADRMHLRHDYSFSPTDSPGDVVSRMKYLHPIFELRQKWSYNNQVCVSRRMRLIHALKPASRCIYWDHILSPRYWGTLTRLLWRIVSSLR